MSNIRPARCFIRPAASSGGPLAVRGWTRKFKKFSKKKRPQQSSLKLFQKKTSLKNFVHAFLKKGPHFRSGPPELGRVRNRPATPHEFDTPVLEFPNRFRQLPQVQHALACTQCMSSIVKENVFLRIIYRMPKMD